MILVLTTEDEDKTYTSKFPWYIWFDGRYYEIKCVNGNRGFVVKAFEGKFTSLDQALTVLIRHIWKKYTLPKTKRPRVFYRRVGRHPRYRMKSKTGPEHGTSQERQTV
jgi:hypothetical protein